MPEIVSGVRMEPESATAVDDPRWTSSSVIARSVGFIVIYFKITEFIRQIMGNL
jgi:hypothetical protein